MSPFFSWAAVAEALRARAAAGDAPFPNAARLNAGQQAALAAIAGRLEGGHRNHQRGVIIADEVGMGKTRVAVAVARAVVGKGGRVAVAVPPGLQYQWRRELEGDGLKAPPMVHTLDRTRFASLEDRQAWRSGPLVLVSHAFPNWRIRADATRWAILPLLVAHHAKERNGRWPHGYRAWVDGIGGHEEKRARELYADLATSGHTKALAWLDDEVNQAEPWIRRYHDSERYHVGGDLRLHLEYAVGLDLGRFDLVIVDEAHKARGEGSGLSRLLGRVLHQGAAPARLGLTATPLALDISEWSHSLVRVGVTGPEAPTRDGYIRGYQEATRALGDRWKTSEADRLRWRAAARGFEQALRPFVLRRDKSEDAQVQRFARSPWGVHDYRHPRPTRIDPAELSMPWREVVFAAEGLSAASSGVRDPAAKRLRLTLANGHGVAAMVADAHADSAASNDLSDPEARRDARAAFWRGLIRTRAAVEGDPLLCHPQLLHAVKLIEDQDELGQKVLVFGRFTAPLEALVSLLNARARLRWMRGDGPEPWPEELAGGTFPAAEDLVAADQLKIERSELPALLERHRERVHRYESDREWFRANVLTLLTRAAALEGLPPGLASLLASAHSEGQPDRDAGLARALLDLMPPEARSRALARGENEALLRDLAQAARLLLAAATDQDSTDEDDQPDEDEARQVWEKARAMVDQDFANRRGGFARLLQGSTRLDTRRLLQAAFNRLHSFPRVLVAQSTVGREGLNLHEACRVMLLLHPEWNPGVVEQQIGRVDRLGSRWARELDEAIAQGVPPERWPRIEVHSIVFGGTYDEHHWSVLEQRWRDLRAQLHGEVIPTSRAGDDPELRARAQRLNADAPKFSPLSGNAG
jgi:hypothetical protein